MERRDSTPQTLQSGLGQCSDLADLGLPEPMPADEIVQRVALCARILDAWPNARPLNRDRTLLEYVNATRGVPMKRLPRCVQLAIDAGGEWLPAAGEVLRRAAVQGAGGPVIGKDPDMIYRHEKLVSRTVQLYLSEADFIAPIYPDELTGQSRLQLGPGADRPRHGWENW